MMTDNEWSALVQRDDAGAVRSALASGRVSAEVANSLMVYRDGCSGMADDPSIYVRRSAVVYATCSGNLPVLRALLESDLVDPNRQSPDVGDEVPAIMRAAGHGCRKMADGNIAASDYQVGLLEELLKHPRTDVNGQDDEGWTALIMAAWCGNVAAAALLLERPELNIEARETATDGTTGTALMSCTTRTIRLPPHIQEYVERTLLYQCYPRPPGTNSRSRLASQVPVRRPRGGCRFDPCRERPPGTRHAGGSAVHAVAPLQRPERRGRHCSDHHRDHRPPRQRRVRIRSPVPVGPRSKNPLLRGGDSAGRRDPGSRGHGGPASPGRPAH